MAKGFNTFNDAVLVEGKAEFLLTVQDLDVLPGKGVENLLIPLPDSSMRRLELQEFQCAYAGGTVIDYSGPDRLDYELTPLAPGQELDALRLEVPSAICWPQHRAVSWLCLCGQMNRESGRVCSSCGKDREAVLELETKAGRAAVLDRHHQHQMQRKRQLQQKREQEHRHAKTKKQAVAVILCGVVAVLIFIVTKHQLSIYRFEDRSAMLQTLYGAWRSEDRDVLEIDIDGTIYLDSHGGGTIYAQELGYVTYTPENGTFNEKSLGTVRLVKQGQEAVFKDRDGTIYTKISDSVHRDKSNGNLRIGTVELEYTENRIICSAQVENVSQSKEYTYVRVKAYLWDDEMNVLAAGWSFAYVDKEPHLQPGQSGEVRIYIPYVEGVATCDLTILDYSSPYSWN